jgi:hypothetical protein
VLLAVLWFWVETAEERRSFTSPFAVTQAQLPAAETSAGGTVVGVEEVKKKKKKRKKWWKSVWAFVRHPVVSLWRSSVVGMLDLMTDVVFCLSLRRAAAEEGADPAVGHLATASAVLIGGSTLVCTVGVVGLYFHGAATKALSRRLFTLESKSRDKAAFFLLVLLAATVNVRLAALLPWKRVSRESGVRSRSVALRRILWLHMLHKFVEDLPQLVLAGIFLSVQSADDASGVDAGAAAAAVLQLTVSGTSLGLTLAWLALQGADDALNRRVGTPQNSERSLRGNMRPSLAERTLRALAGVSRELSGNRAATRSSERSVAEQISTTRQAHAVASTGEEIVPEISRAVRAAGTVTFGEVSTTERKSSLNI